MSRKRKARILAAQSAGYLQRRGLRDLQRQRQSRSSLTHADSLLIDTSKRLQAEQSARLDASLLQFSERLKAEIGKVLSGRFVILPAGARIEYLQPKPFSYAVTERGVLPLSEMPEGARQDAYGIWHYPGGMAAPLTDEEMPEAPEEYGQEYPAQLDGHQIMLP